jgi:multicomponent Na+:H+ antiporter subunit F
MTHHVALHLATLPTLPTPTPALSPIITIAAAIAAALLALALILTIIRLARGPGLPDRVVALDLVGTFAVGACLLISLATGQDTFLFVAVLLALLLFVGTVAAGFYLVASDGDGVAPPPPPPPPPPPTP